MENAEMADDQNETEDKAAEPQEPAGQQDDWETSEGKGGKAAVLADLAAVRKLLAEEKAKTKQFEDRDKTEMDKLRDRLEAAEKALKDKTREAIAASKGIPGELAGAIQGETEAEMEASALTFAKYVGTAEDKRNQSPTQRPGRRGEPVKGRTTETADDWLRKRFHGED
jgi:hypothetical protein